MRTVLFVNAVGEVSGAERSLLALLDALDRRYWLPQLAAPDGPLLREASARGVAVHPVPLAPVPRPRTLRQGWELLVALRAGRNAVARLVRQEKPDLLHANTTAAMLYAAQVRAVPIIWQVRDLVPLDAVGSVLYRRAARVAAISSAVRDDLLSYTRDSGKKIVLLPPAVDTHRFRPAEDRSALQAQLGLPTGPPLIGLVAQFVPWKRHHLFLDALAALVDRPWHAVLAGADLHGDSEYLAALRARIGSAPLAGRVTLLPWQPDPAQLMGALDLAVLTSQREPFGRVLIEAMACGAPVVAVDEGGVRDIILPGTNGLLVAAEPAELAEAMAMLLADAALRAQYGHVGRAHVSARFSLQQQRAALAELYIAVAGNPSLR